MSNRPGAPARDRFGYWNTIDTRWSDNDRYGHVNNAVYYHYIDSVVNRYLIEAGGLDIADSPVIGIVVESACRYQRSFEYPQRIEAGLRVLRLGNSSVGYEVGLFHPGEQQASVWGGFTHVFVDRATQRPVAMPAAIRQALESIEDAA